MASFPAEPLGERCMKRVYPRARQVRDPDTETAAVSWWLSVLATQPDIDASERSIAVFATQHRSTRPKLF